MNVNAVNEIMYLILVFTKVKQNSIKRVRLFGPDQEAWLHGAYNGNLIGHLWLHGEHGWLLRTTTSPID